MRIVGVVAVLIASACNTSPKPKPEPAPGPPAPAPAPPQPVPAPPAPPPAPVVAMPADAHALADASNAFGFELWHRIARPANQAFSPASISIAFAMTALGAKGETAAQIAKVFHFGDKLDSWGQLEQALASKPGVALHIANRLFGAKAFHIEQPFLDQTRTAFGAPLEQLDFAADPEAARGQINSWVADQTGKRITELMPPSSIDELTRLVLVNAIYFLADWQAPFKHEFTGDEPFHVSLTATKTVKMMHGEGWLYGKVDGATLLELPYQGGDTSMLVVLPNAIDGLSKLEASASPAVLSKWWAAIGSGAVTVSLPRFTISGNSIDLAKQLAALGMPLVFDKRLADLTGVAPATTPDQRLYVSHVFHQAFVKIDEKGTEAAAATAVQEAAAGAAAPTAAFVADHPFAFFIVDKPSGLVLFMGHVTDPS